MSALVASRKTVVRRTARSSRDKSALTISDRLMIPPSSSTKRTAGSASLSSEATPAATGRVSCLFLSDTESVHLPVWVRDLQSFRKWAVSDESPEKAPVFFLDGVVWIDMSKQQIFSHIALKQEFFRVLGQLIRSSQLGKFFPDGLLLTNSNANLSGNPDATFVSTAAFREQRVVLVEGKSTGYVEMEGSPDMVLEIISDSSVEKDTQILRELYWKAGIGEYWLVDGRGDQLAFSILKHSPRGYVQSRISEGWLKSAVFGKSFRLTRRLDELGHPDFVLDVK